jgi:hypothetical protein
VIAHRSPLAAVFVALAAIVVAMFVKNVLWQKNIPTIGFVTAAAN